MRLRVILENLQRFVKEMSPAERETSKVDQGPSRSSRILLHVFSHRRGRITGGRASGRRCREKDHSVLPTFERNPPMRRLESKDNPCVFIRIINHINVTSLAGSSKLAEPLHVKSGPGFHLRETLFRVV